MSVKLDSKGVSLRCEGGYISSITSQGVYEDDSEADAEGICSSDAGYNTGLECELHNHEFDKCLN